MVINLKMQHRYWNYLEYLWPCAGGFSEVNAIGTQLRDPINSGLTRWRLTVYMDAVAESERNPVRKHQPIRFSLSVGNERADAVRDGPTCLARPSSQARTGAGINIFHCSGDHVQDWQPPPVDPYYAEGIDHTYIYRAIYLLKQLLHYYPTRIRSPR